MNEVQMSLIGYILSSILVLIIMGYGISLMIGGPGLANRFARKIWNSLLELLKFCLKGLRRLLGYYLLLVAWALINLGKVAQRYGRRLASP